MLEGRALVDRCIPRAMHGSVGRTARLGCHLVALLLAGFASVVGANVFERDDRVFSPAASHPMAAVGLLANGRRQVGSAFLIGECHIMTAFHSAFFIDPEARALEGDAGANVDRAALEFYIGPDDREAGVFKAVSRAHVVEHGNYFPGSPRGMAGDWAILKLDDCLGERFGHLKVLRPSEATLMPSGPLLTLGFPDSDLPRAGISVEAGCNARERGPVVALVGVDCAFERGMSGGPVLMRESGGDWHVVGIMQLRFNPSAGILPAYSSRYRNQMVHAIAFFRAAARTLASAAASEPGGRAGSADSPSFEAEALDQLLRTPCGAVRSVEGLTVSRWRGDLNGDRVDELLFRLCGRRESPDEACAVHLVERDERGGPRRAATLAGADGPVRLGFARMNGWRPVFVGDPGQVRRLVFTEGRHLVEPAGGWSLRDFPSAQAGEEILRIRLVLPLDSSVPPRGVR